MANLPYAWFTAYCDSREGTLRQRSEQVYGAWWRRYETFLAERRQQPQSASSADVDAFLQNYAGNTAIRYFRLLSAVYDVACGHGKAPANPVTALTSSYAREEEPVRVPAPGDKALEALYSIKSDARAWKKVRDRTLVLLAAETGLRRQELVALNQANLRLDAAPPRVTLKTPAHKRDVHLNSRVHQELVDWLALRSQSNIGGDLVFPANPEGRALDPSTVYRIIARYLEKVGAGKDALGASGAQALRASFAHRSLVKGRALVDIQDQLGHKQLLSTADLLQRIDIAEKEPRSAETDKRL